MLKCVEPGNPLMIRHRPSGLVVVSFIGYRRRLCLIKVGFHWHWHWQWHWCVHHGYLLHHGYLSLPSKLRSGIVKGGWYLNTPPKLAISLLQVYVAVPFDCFFFSQGSASPEAALTLLGANCFKEALDMTYIIIAAWPTTLPIHNNSCPPRRAWEQSPFTI